MISIMSKAMLTPQTFQSHANTSSVLSKREDKFCILRPHREKTKIVLLSATDPSPGPWHNLNNSPPPILEMPHGTTYTAIRYQSHISATNLGDDPWPCLLVSVTTLWVYLLLTSATSPISVTNASISSMVNKVSMNMFLRLVCCIRESMSKLLNHFSPNTAHFCLLHNFYRFIPEFACLHGSTQ